MTSKDESAAVVERTDLIVVYDEIFSTDKHAAWTITAARDRNKHVCAIVHGLAPLARHMIEAQV